MQPIYARRTRNIRAARRVPSAMIKLLRWTLFIITTIACIPLMPLLALTVYVLRPPAKPEVVTTTRPLGEP